MELLRELLIDWNLGQHLLLLGEQGVGKNKVADALLGLLGCEREYVQLHRDTTVASLTLRPSLAVGRRWRQGCPWLVLSCPKAHGGPTGSDGPSRPAPKPPESPASLPCGCLKT